MAITFSAVLRFLSYILVTGLIIWFFVVYVFISDYIFTSASVPASSIACYSNMTTAMKDGTLKYGLDWIIIFATFAVSVLLVIVWLVFLAELSQDYCYYINFAVMIAYLVMAGFLLWYTPNSFDQMHSHFAVLLTPMLRIIIASVMVYLIVQMVDARLYGFLKKRFAGRHLLGRNVLSLVTMQLLDTVLFSFAALYGSVHNIMHVIIVSYSIKVLVIICSTPFIALAKCIIKKT